MEVVYCNNCGLKIASDAFSAGTAVRGDDGRIYCGKCDSEGQMTVVGAPAVKAPALEQSVTKFYFCETCGKRITDKQILEGLGRNKKLKGIFCKDCAVGVMTMEFAAVSDADSRKPVRKSGGNAAPESKESPAESKPVQSISRAGIAAAVRSPTPSPGKPIERIQTEHIGKGTRRVEQRDASTTTIIAGVALPPEKGAGKAEDLRARALLFQAAGDAVRAEDYFTKARDGGLGDAVAPYLGRTAALKLEVREAAALEAWKKADGLFANKNWQAAKQACETFQRDYAGSAALVNNAGLLQERLEAIGWALGPPREISLDLGGDVKMEMVLIPAGEFEMGSNDGEKNETPAHKVKISRSFYMGKYVVTQAQYEKVMGKNPSVCKGEDLPVDSVNYVDAEGFCKKAGKFIGRPIRLPTEAEWEYACRAGTKTKYITGDDPAALEQAGWFKENAAGKTHPVGQKKPNAWGLFDMQGNVLQWCQDWYGEDYYGKSETENPHGTEQKNAQGLRVMRGSIMGEPMAGCRSARRMAIHNQLNHDSPQFGFRVVMELVSRMP